MKTPSSLFPDLLRCEQALLCSCSHSCGRSACLLGLPGSDGLYSQSGARKNLPDMVSCHVSGQREDKSHQYVPLLYVTRASPKEDISGYLPIVRGLRKSSLTLDLPRHGSCGSLGAVPGIAGASVAHQTNRLPGNVFSSTGMCSLSQRTLQHLVVC